MGGVASRMDYPGRLFEAFELGGAVAIRDPGVDRSRADTAVAEVVLDELQRESGIQEMGRDGMP